MEFYDVAEDCYPLWELYKKNKWTDCNFDEFENESECLDFFEGDPDMIKIDGRLGYFAKLGDKVFYYFDNDDLHPHKHFVEDMLRKFFSTYETGISLGGEGYAIGLNPQGVYDVHGDGNSPIWDKWEKLETGIAYRGGGGYSYWISDWKEWADLNLPKKAMLVA